MSEKDNERPVRKLTVKNFSVIKEAELEFGKITVLIGPQASGKSLLCKLAYFLDRETIDSAVTSILNGLSLDDFRSALSSLFVHRFAANNELDKDARIAFQAYRYRIDVSRHDSSGSNEVHIRLSPDFESLYGKLSADYSENLVSGIRKKDSQEEIRTHLGMLMSEGSVLDTYYVPAGRSFFTSTALGFSALRNPDIDPLVSEFATTIAWNTNRVSLSSEEARHVLWEILAKMIEIAGGHVEGTSDAPVFVTIDKRVIPFPLLSSGTQELLPLFNVLGRLASEREKQVVFMDVSGGEQGRRRPIRIKKLIYVEEPEAHIFPETQYQLIQLFAWFSNEASQDFSWVITTHSPYILSVFADLVKAGKVGPASPGNRSAVAKVIPEKYWISEGDFAAYKIQNGKLESIFDKETGQIDGDYLDDVSGKISDELGQLLEIQYGKS